MALLGDRPHALAKAGILRPGRLVSHGHAAAADALHARRSLIPNASRRWATAFRLAAGVTISFPRGPSRLRCPAWRRPEAVSAACSRSPASSAAWPPRLPPAELGVPFVDAGVADAMLAAQIGDRNAGLILLQNPDDLLFRKAAALHALVLVVGQNELQTGLSPWGKVTANLQAASWMLCPAAQSSLKWQQPGFSARRGASARRRAKADPPPNHNGVR